MSQRPQIPGKFPVHKLFLPGGVLLLMLGCFGLHNYFTLHGPRSDDLHLLNLSKITNVTLEPEIAGSTRYDNIWLQASNNVKVRYRKRFPYSKEISHLETNYSLLLDVSNLVWGLKGSDGLEHARDYFERYNIEAKVVGLICGTFLSVFGALALFVYFATEYKIAKGTASEKMIMWADADKLKLGLGLLTWLVVYGVFIAPILAKFVPRFALTALWLVSAAILMNFLRPKRPKT